MTTDEPPKDAEHEGGTPLVEFDATDLRYPVRTGALRRITGHVDAVQQVSLKIEPGRTLALVGSPARARPA